MPARRQFERTRTLRGVKSNVSRFRGFAFFAIKPSESRRRCNGLDRVYTPKMIGDGGYEVGEKLAHSGVSVVSAQINSTAVHTGPVISGVPESRAPPVRILREENCRHDRLS